MLTLLSTTSISKSLLRQADEGFPKTRTQKSGPHDSLLTFDIRADHQMLFFRRHTSRFPDAVIATRFEPSVSGDFRAIRKGEKDIQDTE
jgi:hypothetical protein